jgi:hypothetical protein
MNALRILARTILQNAGAVDHGINASQMRKPLGGIEDGRDVENDPVAD